MKKTASLAGLRERLSSSSPGVVIGVIAIVLALTGGAFAASGGLTGKQKKEVKSIAKQFAGKPGKTGATGPAGSQGPAGPKGDAGPQGIQGNPGSSGTPGTPGPAGASVEKVGEGPTVCAPDGGVVYEIEGSGEEDEICNGAEGSPWTAGGALPPGATETGAWSVTGEGNLPAAISFPIPLAQPITAGHIYKIGDPDFFTVCASGINQPIAPPGVLCIYRGEGEASGLKVFTLDSSEENKTGLAGALLYWNVEGFISGSFAVTGCDPNPAKPFPCPTP